MNRKMKKVLSAALCVLLLLALFALPACGRSTAEVTQPADGVTELGEGAKEFGLTVVDAEGKETKFLIRTDEQTVGAALAALDLIQGEQSEYGLYVKTVNGVTADYDTDGSYWAFYIGEEYASTGVDSTEITEGTEYALKVEK